MKKLLVSVVIIAVFAFYILTHGRLSSAVASVPPQGGASATSSPTIVSGGGTAPPGSQYKNGAYTGGSADAQWGIVQVQAIIQNGKLIDVKFLQYPNERSRSVEINGYAIPQLTTEAIQAQSAQVDVVSGATDTSYAFMQSLSDALTQAQA
jgi:uncharacterized protein with FMN-binding domain